MIIDISELYCGSCGVAPTRTPPWNGATCIISAVFGLLFVPPSLSSSLSSSPFLPLRRIKFTLLLLCTALLKCGTIYAGEDKVAMALVVLPLALVEVPIDAGDFALAMGPIVLPLAIDVTIGKCLPAPAVLSRSLIKNADIVY